jgi:hypothetical protein
MMLRRRGRHAAPLSRRRAVAVAVLYGLPGAVLLVALFFGLLHAGERAQRSAQPSTAAASPRDATPAPALAAVVYEVRSDGPRVDVTYADQTGVHSLFDVPAPWSTTVQLPAGPALGALVTARAAGRATVVSCRILVDGVQVAAMSVKGRAPVICTPGDG